MADYVTTLGGTEIDMHGWGMDYAYLCTQKGIGAPPGMSPISVSEPGMSALPTQHAGPVLLRLELLRKYWSDRPATYHHTAPILQI